MRSSFRISCSFRAALCALTVSVAAVSAPIAESATIGLSIPTLDPFRTRLRDAIQRQVNATPGASLQVTIVPDGNVAQQNADIADMIRSGVNGLIVIPLDAEKAGNFTSRAREADIPVVLINNGPRVDWLPGRIVMAIPNELVAGRLQMHILAAHMGGRGNLAIITGPSSFTAATERTRGIREVLRRYPDIRIVEQGEAGWNREKAANLMAGWMRSGVHIDAVAANNDEMAIGAYAGWVAGGGKGPAPLIAGVDASPEALEAMAAHHLSLTVRQDPAQQGEEAVIDVFKLINHQPVPQYDWAPFQLVSTLP